MSEASIRPYAAETDRDRLIALYKTTSVAAPAFVRDGDLVSHFTSFPGLQPEGILVLERGDRIEGCVMVVSGEDHELREGRILDLRATSAQAARRLVQAASDYCREQRCDVVSLRLPPGLGLERSLKGLIPVSGAVLMAKALDLCPLVEAILAANPAASRIVGRRALALVFDDHVVVIDGRDSTLTVARHETMPEGPVISCSMDAATFMQLLFGLTHPFRACFQRRIVVSRTRDVFLWLRLLSALRVPKPYLAEIDRR